MKKLNVLASIVLAALPLVTGGQSAMAKGLPEFFNPQTTTTINFGTTVTGAMPIWMVNGTKYTLITSFDGSSARLSAKYWAWAKNHHVKIFANRPALYVNLAAFIKAFYHPFHPVYDGPNLAPPLPKGVTMKQWEAAIVEAKAAASPLQSVSASIKLTNEYSPLATKTQWFNDPSDPFFNKSFPVKDLKDGFVLNRKPLVMVIDLLKRWYVMQYVGYNAQRKTSFWFTETVNGKGKMTGVIGGLGETPNGYLNSHFHYYPNAGSAISYNTNDVPNSIWAVGLGKNVVPLMKWNPAWMINPQGI